MVSTSNQFHSINVIRGKKTSQLGRIFATYYTDCAKYNELISAIQNLFCKKSSFLTAINACMKLTKMCIKIKCQCKFGFIDATIPKCG